MPKYSSFTFAIQPVEQNGLVSGFVVSGFFSKTQLEALRTMVDNEDYERTKKWRGEYQELAKAMVAAVDKAL